MLRIKLARKMYELVEVNSKNYFNQVIALVIVTGVLDKYNKDKEVPICQLHNDIRFKIDLDVSRGLYSKEKGKYIAKHIINAITGVLRDKQDIAF